MNKLWLIIKREYLIRVKKKSFLLITLLAPLTFTILTFGTGFLTGYMAKKSSMKILVKDDSGILSSYMKDKKKNTYKFTDEPLDSIKQTYHKKGYDMLVYMPSYKDSLQKVTAKYYSHKKPGLLVLKTVEHNIEKAYKSYNFKKAGIDKQLIENLSVNVHLESGQTDVKSAKTGKLSIIIATVLAFAMGFLLYMVIFVFGTQVMRSVMEEKINRIVEIIISSAKPFELMLGKVIGVGAVGLTQLAIWIVLIFIIISVAGMMFNGSVHANEITEMQSQINQGNLNGLNVAQIINEFFALNWALILPSFILYFLGGYFLYSSLFAAVGAAIGDDLGESQSLTLPIVIPVIFAMIIMMNAVKDPDSSLAVFGSIFPLFSPIVMPARLPFDPPLWQIILSLVLLILTCILFVWLSAKIYRAGILMYGKKFSLKEMGKLLLKK